MSKDPIDLDNLTESFEPKCSRITVEQLPVLFQAIDEYDNRCLHMEMEAAKIMAPLREKEDEVKDYDTLWEMTKEHDKIAASLPDGFVHCHCGGSVTSDLVCLDKVEFPKCKHAFFEQTYCPDYGCYEYDSGCVMDDETTNRFRTSSVLNLENYFYDNFFEGERAHECPFYEPESND